MSTMAANIYLIAEGVLTLAVLAGFGFSQYKPQRRRTRKPADHGLADW